MASGDRNDNHNRRHEEIGAVSRRRRGEQTEGGDRTERESERARERERERESGETTPCRMNRKYNPV